jgi:hypothetical protein
MAPDGMTPPDRKEAGFGFAAGTLLHTDMGLVPIERVRIGDRVWSRPEGDAGATPAWRQVVAVRAFGEQAPVLVHCHRPVNNLCAFCAMGRQRFWVTGSGWFDAEQLECGSELAVLEGAPAMALCGVPIYRTLEPQIGWAEGAWGSRSYDNAGNLIDLRDERRIGIGTKENWNIECWGEDGRGFPFTMPVFALEVEEFHTYYVSAQGIWAHDGTGTV